MAGLGICAGVFTALFTGAFLGQLVFHDNEAGVLPGIVAGIWAAWPLIHQARVQRYNFLHPVPKEYKVSTKHAFSKVREILAETAYNFGDKWRVSTADTQSGRIAADLTYMEEHLTHEMNSRGEIIPKRERLQRYIGLEVVLQDTGGGSTVIQLDFSPRVQGLNISACDSKVSDVCRRIKTALGQGVLIGDPEETKLPAPPWWLLGLSALTLLTMLSDIQKAVFS